MCGNYARILLGCYRTSEVSDPQVFTAAVIAVLAKFDEPVIRAVCDPVSGLPSGSKWLPTTSEILTACNDELRQQETIARYAAMGTVSHTHRWTPNPPTQGDGGPGTVYANYDEAMRRTNGKPPNGVFSKEREIPYRG
jgi:hypothetical protein